MKARGRYIATTVGPTSVILTPKVGSEDEDKSGEPGILGVGVVTINTGVTPAAGFWRTTAVQGQYLIEFSKV